MAKLTDSDIIAVIDYGVAQAVGLSDSRLSKEREVVARYHDAEYPKPAHHGDSKYLSLDVYDGVESMRAQLLEVFSGSSRPVEFEPANGEDVVAARVRTDYVTNVLFTQNRGFSILRDTITDGLMNRNGILKVWWQSKVKDEFYDMADATVEELQAHLTANDNHDVTEVDLHEDGQTIKRARLRVRKDRSQVMIRCLPPEEFGISAMSESLQRPALCFHKRLMTASDLIKDGYDPKIVKKLQDTDRLWQVATPEKIERFEQTDDMMQDRIFENGQQANRECMVYECYLELDLDDSGTSQLYKVVKVGTTILDKEPVDDNPFVDFCPLPRAHAFWGTNYAKLLIPTQNARTHLTRSIINHAMITNNPRLEVLKGTLANPRELMENRVGGIVNVNKPNGIQPIAQAGLNPFVFQTISMLDSDKEEITGISRLSQGLDKDAISKQNSQGMVQDLISVSQIRQRVIARNFAENFLRDLYTKIYKLVVQNEDRQKIIQVAGSWTPVDFMAWPEDTEMSVSFHLGYGERDKQMAKWTKADEYLSKMAPEFYPKEKRHAVFAQIFHYMDVKDMDNYVLTAEQVQPPPPDPMHMAEVALKNADAALKQAQAQAIMAGIQNDKAALALKGQDAMAKMQMQTRNADEKLALEHDKLAHKVAVDAAEISLEQQAQAIGKLSAEAMPTR